MSSVMLSVRVHVSYQSVGQLIKYTSFVVCSLVVLFDSICSGHGISSLGFHLFPRVMSFNPRRVSSSLHDVYLAPVIKEVKVRRHVLIESQTQM